MRWYSTDGYSIFFSSKKKIQENWTRAPPLFWLGRPMTDELLVFFTCATQTGRWLHEHHHHHGPITFVSICKWHLVRLTNFFLKVPPGGLDLSLDIRDRVPVVHVFQYTGAVEGAVHSISPKSLNSRLFFYFLFVESHRLQPPLARPGGGHSSFYLFQNRRPKINEIVVKIFIELFQNFFLGGLSMKFMTRPVHARALSGVALLGLHTPVCWRWIDDGWPSGKWETRTDCPPPSIFHFFFRSKNLLCVPPLWPWSGRRLIPPQKFFFQIQLLSIGRANNKKLNQVKKKKKAEASISRATPPSWRTTTTTTRVHRKENLLSSELLDTKKRWNQWTLWFVPSKVARVCTSTCNDDLVAFFLFCCRARTFYIFWGPRNVFQTGGGQVLPMMNGGRALKIIWKWTQQYGRLQRGGAHCTEKRHQMRRDNDRQRMMATRANALASDGWWPRWMASFGPLFAPIDGARTHTHRSSPFSQTTVHPSDHPSIHPSIVEASPTGAFRYAHCLSNNQQKKIPRNNSVLAAVPRI